MVCGVEGEPQTIEEQSRGSTTVPGCACAPRFTDDCGEARPRARKARGITAEEKRRGKIPAGKAEAKLI